jgi:hypothetical protein
MISPGQLVRATCQQVLWWPGSPGRSRDWRPSGPPALVVGTGLPAAAVGWSDWLPGTTFHLLLLDGQLWCCQSELSAAR